MSVSTPDFTAPETVEPQPEPEHVKRPYAMLEQRSVADLLREAVESMQERSATAVDVADLIAHFADKQVFEELGTWQARNADHAYRLVFADRYANQEGEPLPLVAVSAKRWQVRRVSSNMRHSVKVA
jgi:hypothetical protein